MVVAQREVVNGLCVLQDSSHYCIVHIGILLIAILPISPGLHSKIRRSKRAKNYIAGVERYAASAVAETRGITSQVVTNGWLQTIYST